MLSNHLKDNEILISILKIKEKLNLLRETLDDIADHYTLSSDTDARTGHKTSVRQVIWLFVSLRSQERTRKNLQREVYYFDVEKFKVYSCQKGCYNPNAKYKTYKVTIKTEMHREQSAFQDTGYFKEKYRERYKIEAKNAELKHVYGYDRAISYGLSAMQMQGATECAGDTAAEQKSIATRLVAIVFIKDPIADTFFVEIVEVVDL